MIFTCVFLILRPRHRSSIPSRGAALGLRSGMDGCVFLLPHGRLWAFGAWGPHEMENVPAKPVGGLSPSTCERGAGGGGWFFSNEVQFIH